MVSFSISKSKADYLISLLGVAVTAITYFSNAGGILTSASILGTVIVVLTAIIDIKPEAPTVVAPTPVAVAVSK